MEPDSNERHFKTQTRLENRRLAAQCVARLFSGVGHKIREDAGAGFGAERAELLTSFERLMLKETFYVFLGLIEDHEYNKELVPTY